MAKLRLDTLLAQRGLFASRARAAASVMAGEVRLGGSGGERAAKPGQMVAEDVEVAVDERPRFVSRGGIKLANALDATGIDPAGRRCLDVGASTGGFTDCLLQRGAAQVIALDVAYGELDWSLRTDERVTVLERTNARAMAACRSALRPRPRRGRRLVHLAGQGASRGARVLRGALRRAGDGQAAVRGRARAGGQGGRRARARGPPGGARRGRAGRARSRRRGARLRLVGPAGAEGQPRDVRVAGRGGARRAPRRPRRRCAREVEP